MEADEGTDDDVDVPDESRTNLGPGPGSVIEIPVGESGAPVASAGRVEPDGSGRLVARSDTVVTDEAMTALVDSDRRRAQRVGWHEA